MDAGHLVAGSRQRWRHRAGQQLARLAGLAIAVGASAVLAAGNQPLEYLDEQTGSTITVVGRPLVFTHEVPGSAHSAGDYVTLAGAAVDRSGDITYVLIVYFWSAAASAVESLTLQADGSSIQLILRSTSAREVGIGMPVHKPPFGAGTPYIYATDIPTLRLIAESHRLTLRIPRQDKVLDYELFQDRRVALKEFVRRVDGKD